MAASGAPEVFDHATCLQACLEEEGCLFYRFRNKYVVQYLKHGSIVEVKHSASSKIPTRREMMQIGGSLGGHPPPILPYSTPLLAHINKEGI